MTPVHLLYTIYHLLHCPSQKDAQTLLTTIKNHLKQHIIAPFLQTVPPCTYHSSSSYFLSYHASKSRSSRLLHPHGTLIRVSCNFSILLMFGVACGLRGTLVNLWGILTCGLLCVLRHGMRSRAHD